MWTRMGALSTESVFWRHTASLPSSACGGGIGESFIQTFIKETHVTSSRPVTGGVTRVSRPALR